MKTILVTLLLTCLTTFLKAQDGVFLTYEDFKANKIIAADGESLNYNFGTHGFASVKQNGVKRKWKLDEIYGLRSHDVCWRTLHSKDTKDGMARIELVGNYILYIASIPVPHTSSGVGGTTTTSTNVDHYYISKTLTSTVYPFTAHLESLEDLADAHKDEFKELTPYLRNATKKDRSGPIVEECIKKSAEYKLPSPLPKSKVEQ